MRGSVPTLLLLVTFFACSPSPERVKLELTEALPLARQSTLVAARGPLGASEAQPFLGPGLEVNRTEGTVTALEAELPIEFYAYQTGDLELSLEVCGSSSEELKWLINGQTGGTLNADETWTTVIATLPQEGLKVGTNRLLLQGVHGVRFRNFSLSLLDSPAPVQVEGRSLLMKSQSFVEFPLPDSEETTLRTGLKGGQQGGPLQLKVTLSTDRETLWSQAYQSAQTVEVTLPATTEPVKLSFQAGSDLQLEDPVLLRPAPLAPSPARPVSSTEKPNIVLFVVDTLRADRLPRYGYPRDTAPHLEQFAEDAVTYANVVAEAPWTKPSVATLFTSKDTQGHGVAELFDVLPAESQTLAEQLKSQGYQTAAIVANPMLSSDFGFPQGFDSYQVLEHQTRGEQVTELAEEWLASRDSKRPFFLYLHLFDPHVPYDPPSPYANRWLEEHGLTPGNRLNNWSDNAEEKWLAGYLELTLKLEQASRIGQELISLDALKEGSAMYDGEVAYSDAQFGRWLEHLKKEGLYQDSLIVFTSDHGEEFGEHGHLGHLHSLYQQLLAVPLVLKYPKGQRAGERVSQTCHHLDVFPTLLQAAGAPIPEKILGRALQSQPDGPRVHLSRVDAGSEALRFDLIPQELRSQVGHSRGYALRLGALKYVRFEASRVPIPALALYDLASDPQEKTNLLDQRPVTALWLDSLLQQRLAGESSKATKTLLPKDVQSLPYLR